MLDDFMNIQQQARVLQSLRACLPRSHEYASGGKYRLKTILSQCTCISEKEIQHPLRYSNFIIETTKPPDSIHDTHNPSIVVYPPPPLPKLSHSNLYPPNFRIYCVSPTTLSLIPYHLPFPQLPSYPPIYTPLGHSPWQGL